MREFLAVTLVSVLAGVAFGIARPIYTPPEPPPNRDITALQEQRGY
jgi:hypothetical protein